MLGAWMLRMEMRGQGAREMLAERRRKVGQDGDGSLGDREKFLQLCLPVLIL